MQSTEDANFYNDLKEKHFSNNNLHDEVNLFPIVVFF